jgi:hypothetical protein
MSIRSMAALLVAVFMSVSVVSNASSGFGSKVISEAEELSASVQNLLPVEEFAKFDEGIEYDILDAQIEYYADRIRTEDGDRRDIDAVAGLRNIIHALKNLEDKLEKHYKGTLTFVEKNQELKEMPEDGKISATVFQWGRAGALTWSQERSVPSAIRKVVKVMGDTPTEYQIIVLTRIIRYYEMAFAVQMNQTFVNQAVEDFSEEIMLDHETITDAARILRQAINDSTDETSVKKAKAFEKQLKSTLKNYHKRLIKLDGLLEVWQFQIEAAGLLGRPESSEESREQTKMLKAKEKTEKRIQDEVRSLKFQKSLIEADCEVAINKAWVQYYQEQREELQDNWAKAMARGK